MARKTFQRTARKLPTASLKEWKRSKPAPWMAKRALDALLRAVPETWRQPIELSGLGKLDLHNPDPAPLWLQSWDECPNHRIYIAGPMTGLPDNNYHAFHDAAARLRKRCWHVENPAENPVPHVDANCSWTAYMRMGVSQLMTCHAIYLLPGWQHSKGASLEYMVAQQLGLAVYEHAKQDDVLQEQLQQLASKPSLRPEQQPIPA